MQQYIGIKRAAIINGGKEIYVDQDDIKIQDNTLYTEKQAYDIVKKEYLPFDSCKYFVKEQCPFKGGSVQYQTLDLGKMQGINRFLTGNEEQDKQILKFAKREYRKKYGLENLDNVQLKYNFDDVEQQISQTQNELKVMYKAYSKQKTPDFTKEIQKASRRVFGVDYGTFLKYKSQITGSQLYVDEVSDQYIEDEQRMNKQLFGGCQCDLANMFEFNKYQVLRYDGGKRNRSLDDNNDSLIQYLYDQVKQEYRYEPSGFLMSAINSNQDKLKFLQEIKQGGSVNTKKTIENQPQPQQETQPTQETQQQQVVENPQPQQQQEIQPTQETQPQQPEQQGPLLQGGEQDVEQENDGEEKEEDLYSEESKSESYSSESDEMNYKIDF